MSVFAIQHARSRLAASPSGPVTVDRNALEQLLAIAERAHPEAGAVREFEAQREKAVKKVKGG